METRSIDYTRSLELLGLFNRFIENDAQLKKFFIYKEWNLLQAYQGSLFGDMKVWTRDQTLESLRPTWSVVVGVKSLITAVVMVIISLVSIFYAYIKRGNTAVFSGDKIDGKYANDFRLEPLYHVLHEEHIKYLEIVHTLGGMTMIKHFLERERPVIYLESIDVLVSPFVFLYKLRARIRVSHLELNSFSINDRKFVQFILEKYISMCLISRVRLMIFTALLSILNIKKVFSIDDTRHYNELMAATRILGIPSYAIQHGHFTKYHAGWLKKTNLKGESMRPRYLLVWSNYWKQELKRLDTIFDEDEILVGGERWPLSSTSLPGDFTNDLSILIPYENDAPKSEVRRYIDDFLSLENVEVIFKIRADHDKQEQLTEYGLDKVRGKLTIVRSVNDVIERVSLVAGTYSTFLYDMVVAEKPVAILESSIDYGEGMVINGLADLLHENDDLFTTLRHIAATPTEQLKKRKELLTGSWDGSMAQTIRGIIRQHV